MEGGGGWDFFGTYHWDVPSSKTAYGGFDQNAMLDDLTSRGYLELFGWLDVKPIQISTKSRDGIVVRIGLLFWCPKKGFS